MRGYKVFCLLCIISLAAPAQKDNQTQAFAAARAARVSNVAYALSLDLEKGRETYAGLVVIRFDLKSADGDLVVDFSGRAVTRLEMDEVEVKGFEFSDDEGRITIPGSALRAGANVLTIDFEGLFRHGGSGLHQFTDPADGLEYCYSDFEPNDAHRMFPCFDQPDLKASYEFEATAPSGWVVVSNAPVVHQLREGARTRTVFRKTKPFSTYLFHVSAGPYAFWQDTEFRLPLGLYCRKSVARDMDAERLFAATRKGFDFFEAYFEYPYPFGKYDQIFVPEFNAGAMENVGAVTFNEIFLTRSKPTRSQLNRRDMVIFHEMAHMWFGDLVTMKWWNDLWLNESFASYMAYLAMEATGVEDVWATASGSKEGAFRADQRVTTHPIVTEIPDIRAASNNFDAITYNKGLAVLRQLDSYLGQNRFRDGLRHYFQTYQWDNTTLSDFIGALGHVAGRSLEEWTQKWLESADVNTIRIEYRLREGRIADAEILQSPGASNDVLRPHAADLGLFYTNAEGVPELGKKIEISYDNARQLLPQLNGLQAPAFLLPNVSDYDYVKVSLDEHSLAWIRENFRSIADLETKTLVWRVLWVMVQDGQLSPKPYLEMALEQMRIEKQDGLLSGLSRNVQRVIATYIPNREEQFQYNARFFDLAKTMLAAQKPGDDLQQTWFMALGNSAWQPQQLNFLEQILTGEVELKGLPLDNRRKWSMIGQLVAYGHPGVDLLIEKLKKEDDSSYAKNYLLYLSSLAPTMEAKKASWEKLTGSGDHSLTELGWIARGMSASPREDLVKPFIGPYFDYLPRAYEEREWEFVNRFAFRLFPTLGYEDTVKQARNFLKREGLDPTLRDLVMERLDDLERDIKIRKNWSEAGQI